MQKLTAEDYLRSKYGAYRGHFAWRLLEQAFVAGQLSVITGPDCNTAEQYLSKTHGRYVRLNYWLDLRDAFNAGKQSTSEFLAHAEA